MLTFAATLCTEIDEKQISIAGQERRVRNIIWRQSHNEQNGDRIMIIWDFTLPLFFKGYYVSSVI